MGGRLLIDGQVLQTNAWYRGMGKYTLQMLQSLDSSVTDLELVLVFNDNLVCDEVRFSVVKSLCPHIRQVRYDLPVTQNKTATAREYRRALETSIEVDFMGEENHYLLTSIFSFDFFAEFPPNVRKALVFYDLTPLLFWHDLGGYFPPDLYMRRFQQILEADVIFAISETTRKDLLNIFGLPTAKVININGGATEAALTAKAPSSFDIPKRYILFPTGDLPHKNNEVAIKGYEQYRSQYADGQPLLVTSHFQESSQEKLQALSRHLIFTGNVSDDELGWLYKHADAILFASKYEGLGMPVLDGVYSKKPVITSRIPVFEEMSKSAFYYFDASDPTDLREAIKRAITRENFQSKLDQYSKLMTKYTWQNTAKTLVSNITKLNSSEALQPKPKGVSTKAKIALACLHPGIGGQIGRWSESLQYVFGQFWDIDFYFDADGYHYREMERPTFLDYLQAPTFDIMKLNALSYKKYDTVIYLLDDMSLPSRLAQRAGVLPGIALAGFKDKRLTRQQQLFKELILDNQSAVFQLEKNSYENNLTLAKQIDNEIKKFQEKPLATVAVIRSGKSKRGIMRSLTRVNHDA